MKKKYAFIFTLIVSCIYSSLSYAQYQMQSAPRLISQRNNPMTTVMRNYKTFTVKTIDTSAEVLAANKGYEQHPEIGTLYEGAPDADCYELIGDRTEINKTFVKKGSNGKDLFVQTASIPIHYRDANGNWRTIKTLLEPDLNHQGVYAAYEQPAPICINTSTKYTSIGKEGKQFRYNNNLELIYVKPDGSQVSLGSADWTHHTAGDEGVYVTNAWAGIDIELFTIRGALKTNFLINHALPEYANGKLLIRDHLQMDNGLSLYASGKTQFAGNMEIRNENSEKIYDISAATACEKGNIKTTMQLLDFYIDGNQLDIAVPGNFLNREDASYPVIVDPLVSLATASAVTGSTYSTDWTVPCVYANAATVPANITITDIQFAFTFATGSIAWVSDGAFDFRKAGCRSPTGPTGLTGFYWCCSSTFSPGTCTALGGTTYSILADLSACIPPPQCPSYNLNLTMDFYQNTAPSAPCATTYIYATTPLTITVIGHTVEFVSATASPSTICLGASTSLTSTGIYGVPPYTFSWSPGPVIGSPVSVSPTTTTTYTVTITDACGITATGTKTVVVNAVAPITGTPTVCVGNTTALADATGGAHTWSSSNSAVATVNPASGLVTGVSVGTATITYLVTGTGCYATMVVTVTPLPSGITGITTLCVGSTTTLSDATGGGTWTSSNTAIATISGTGVVTGVSVGTVTITYSLGGACYVTTTVTVNLLTPITGTLTVCQGLTTLLSNATGGGTWISGNSAIATVSTTGLVTGVSAGTVTISYTTPAGCSATAIVTVTAISPITGILSICLGGTTTLSNASGPGTWSSGSTGIATISSTGVVTGLTVGIAPITFTTTAGCSAYASLTVNGTPVITGTTTVCVGSTTVLSCSTTGGTWTSGSITIATIGASTGVVTGVSAGTVTITYTTPAGCVGTTTVTVNPLPFPIAGAGNICEGFSTTLTDATLGGTWYSSNTSIATIDAAGVLTGISGGTITVSYTSVYGCVITAPFTVNGTPPAITGIQTVCVGSTTFLTDAMTGGTWTCIATTVATIDATGTVTGVSAGTAIVTYTSSFGCFITTIVTVNPLPGEIKGIFYICENATTLLTNETPGGAWSSSDPTIASVNNISGLALGNSAGTCNIIYTVLGCTSTIVLTVNPTPPPIDGLETICPNSTITLSDAIPGGTWKSNDPTVVSIDFYTGVVTGIGYGIATITYTDLAGCVITGIVSVNVPPKVSFYVNPDVCIGDTVHVELTSSSNSITDYIWDFGSAQILSATSNTYGPFSVMWNSIGTYVITVTGVAMVHCPSLTVHDTVLVHDFPNSSIQPPIIIGGKSNICIGDSILLRAGYNDQGYSYFWTPLEYFEQNNIQNVYGRILQGGNVYLTIRDPFRCTSTSSIMIDAKPCCIVSMPSAFSPNGDGLNDIFRPVAAGTHGVHVFRIMNRWGECVYESTNAKLGWDGNYNGVPQEVGTYFYYFAYDCEGKTVEMKGEATLVR